MTTITEQTIELAHNFPIGCKVQILDDNVFWTGNRLSNGSVNQKKTPRGCSNSCRACRQMGFYIPTKLGELTIERPTRTTPRMSA